MLYQEGLRELGNGVIFRDFVVLFLILPVIVVIVVVANFFISDDANMELNLAEIFFFVRHDHAQICT